MTANTTNTMVTASEGKRRIAFVVWLTRRLATHELPATALIEEMYDFNPGQVDGHSENTSSATKQSTLRQHAAKIWVLIDWFAVKEQHDLPEHITQGALGKPLLAQWPPPDDTPWPTPTDEILQQLITDRSKYRAHRTLTEKDICGVFQEATFEKLCTFFQRHRVYTSQFPNRTVQQLFKFGEDSTPAPVTPPMALVQLWVERSKFFATHGTDLLREGSKLRLLTMTGQEWLDESTSSTFDILASRLQKDEAFSFECVFAAADALEFYGNARDRRNMELEHWTNLIASLSKLHAESSRHGRRGLSLFVYDSPTSVPPFSCLFYEDKNSLKKVLVSLLLPQFLGMKCPVLLIDSNASPLVYVRFEELWDRYIPMRDTTKPLVSREVTFGSSSADVHALPTIKFEELRARWSPTRPRPGTWVGAAINANDPDAVRLELLRISDKNGHFDFRQDVYAFGTVYKLASILKNTTGKHAYFAKWVQARKADCFRPKGKETAHACFVDPVHKRDFIIEYDAKQGTNSFCGFFKLTPGWDPTTERAVLSGAFMQNKRVISGGDTDRRGDNGWLWYQHTTWPTDADATHFFDSDEFRDAFWRSFYKCYKEKRREDQLVRSLRGDRRRAR